MTTPEEIGRRVEQVDTPRSAARTVAAQQVGELAKRRAAIAEQLADIEGQLGDVLAAASGVMSIDEVATFTDVPAADLTRWLTARKPARTKRKRPAAEAGSTTQQGPSTAKAPSARPTSTPAQAVPTRAENANARVPAAVT